jgi:hypothetical protein
MNKALIYDFETLSQNPEKAAVISLAVMVFDLDIAESKGYDYETLLDSTRYMKFNVAEQIEKFDREIEMKTLNWWKEQGAAAVKELKPSKFDVSITEIQPLIKSLTTQHEIKYVFTRNNTFDPVIFHGICRKTEAIIPYPWWTIRDTKSFIMGLTYGHKLKDDFIPTEAEGLYVKHDPRHDIVLDVMRIQTILSAKFGE